MDFIKDLDELVSFLEQTHPHLYRNIGKEDFYKEIDRIKSLYLTKNQFQLELMKLFAKVKDPHTTVNIPTFNIPFKIKPIGDKLYIVDDYVNEPSQFIEKYISSINGIPVNKYIEKFNIYISYDTESWKKTCYCDLLSNLAFLKMVESDKPIVFELTDEKDNSVVPMNVDEESKKPRVKKEEKLTRKFDDQSGTMYIQYGTCGDIEEIKNSDFIKQTIDDLSKSPTKKVVVDLRDNHGGNSIFAIPLIDVLKTYPDVDVLVDGGTFSSAFMTAVNLKNIGAKIIGSETGMAENHFGNCAKHELPSGIVVYCSSKEYIMHDGKLHGLSDEIHLGEVTDVVYGKDENGNPIHHQLPTNLLHIRKPYVLDDYISFSSFNEYKLFNESVLKGIIIAKTEDSTIQDEGETKQNFDWSSPQEKANYEEKKIQNQEHLLEHPIEQSKERETINAKEKPKVLTVQPIKQSATSNNSEKSGFVNIVLLLSVLLIASGVVSFIAYYLISR